jgi:hypothetical protein
MATIECRGTSIEIKEQCKNKKSFFWGVFLFPSQKMEKGMNAEEMRKKEKRSGNGRKRKCK